MRKIRILFILVAAFLPVFFFNCAESLISNNTAPRVENGVLDLSTWNFKDDGPVALDGKWEFYWNTHLKPGDLSNETPPSRNGFIEVPGNWNGYDINGKKINGEEAIGLYQRAIEAGEPFDAVILDLTVPGAMGGKEAIGRLCQIDANVKAIVSSGYSIDPVMSNYEKYGFCGVVEKPYNLQKLGEILKEIIKL